MGEWTRPPRGQQYDDDDELSFFIMRMYGKEGLQLRHQIVVRLTEAGPGATVA